VKGRYRNDGLVLLQHTPCKTRLPGYALGAVIRLPYPTSHRLRYPNTKTSGSADHKEYDENLDANLRPLVEIPHWVTCLALLLVCLVS